MYQFLESQNNQVGCVTSETHSMPLKQRTSSTMFGKDGFSAPAALLNESCLLVFFVAAVQCRLHLGQDRICVLESARDVAPIS